MAESAVIREQVIELLELIDLERPQNDEREVRERLREYVQALGLPAPRVRFAPDVRALRAARVYPSRDRGHWWSLADRQWRLDAFAGSAAWRRGLRSARPVPASPSEKVGSVVRSDRAVLEVGLGSSEYVRAVRHVTESLGRITGALDTRLGVAPPSRAEALVTLAEAAAAGLLSFAVGAGGEEDLVALLRPRMRLDSEGRLHDWDGLPAAEWPSGRGLYFWRGVWMTESAGRRPDAVTASRIAGWANAERRRVAIERMGLEGFIGGLGAQVVQQDDYGRLWRTEREIDGERFVAVEVVNATAEPDGSVRRYFLRVPPDVRSARRGVAWTFGLTRRAYAPEVES